jgi:peptidyl-tRNA hydrolase
MNQEFLVNNPPDIIWLVQPYSLVKLTGNLVPRAFLVVARELRKTLVKYDEISKILGDLSHAQ